MVTDKGRRRISEAARRQMSDPKARARLSALHKGKPNLGVHNTNHCNRQIVKTGCPWCETQRTGSDTE